VERGHGGTVTEVTLSRITDFAALGQRWRALEAQADGSFFQGWTWVGCLAEERFTDPVLAAATERGETIALALFNRRGRLPGTLYLGESGVPARDVPYVEYNGVLCARGREMELSRLCLNAARHAPLDGRVTILPRRLVLSGITDLALDAARDLAGEVWVRRSLPAPYVDLARLRREGADYLDGRSANTRQQVRRSDRAYAAWGPLTVRRAETVEEALGYLETLRALHQATWTVRGQPGSFADPFFGRFHRALIERGMGRGEIDLLRITAGAELIGILYNFRYRLRALAYQSGLAYAAATGQQRPGLTCHHRAIRWCLEQGLTAYDFLAGDDRYKRSLSDGAETLHWVEVDARWALRPLARRGRSRLARLFCTKN
jgi:CelD/BcsL family acetyltransferase involved in cellulose biosynthesis